MSRESIFIALGGAAAAWLLFRKKKVEPTTGYLDATALPDWKPIPAIPTFPDASGLEKDPNFCSEPYIGEDKNRAILISFRNVWNASGLIPGQFGTRQRALDISHEIANAVMKRVCPSFDVAPRRLNVASYSETYGPSWTRLYEAAFRLAFQRLIGV